MAACQYTQLQDGAKLLGAVTISELQHFLSVLYTHYWPIAD